jgi:hypothetical protein
MLEKRRLILIIVIKDIHRSQSLPAMADALPGSNKRTLKGDQSRAGHNQQNTIGIMGLNWTEKLGWMFGWLGTDEPRRWTTARRLAGNC